MERRVGMMTQEIHPDRVIAGLKARSSKIVRVDTRGEPVALETPNKTVVGERDNCSTYRMSSPSQILISAGHIEIESLSVVDPVSNFHFMIGQWNLYKETPEGKNAGRSKWG